MENQEIDRETDVLQEGVETVDDNSVVAGDSGGEGQEGVGGTAGDVEEAGETSQAPQEGPEEGQTENIPETFEEGREEVQEEQESQEEETIEPYTFENPMPVMIVEPEVEEYELEVFSLTGSYPGTISDTYLNYFRGIVQKLDWNQHYVVYRSGQYSYTMVYGEEVALNGTRFTGNGNVVNLYRNTSSGNSDWYVGYSSDSLSLSAGSLYVYSDLGMYPTLKEGGSSIEFMALLFAVGFAVVYSVCHDIFDYIMEHVYRK